MADYLLKTSKKMNINNYKKEKGGVRPERLQLH